MSLCESINMDVLPLHYKVINFFGFYKQKHGQSSMIFKLFRSCHKFISVMILFYFMIFQMIEIGLSSDDLGDLSDLLFLSFTEFTTIAKLINFTLRSNKIIKLLNHLRSTVCQAKTDEERIIKRSYDIMAKKFSWYIMIPCLITGWIFVIVPIFEPSGSMTLPFRFCVPYNMSNRVTYSFTYMLQSIAIFYSIIINITMDTLVYGFIILAIGQLDLLRHRIENLQNISRGSERKSQLFQMWIGNCSEHYTLISAIIKEVQTQFMGVIALMFMVSLVTLCMTIFQISKEISVFKFEFWSFLLYLLCISAQLFFYCLFGDKLDEKNYMVTTAIYSIDWTDEIAKEHKKLLLLMMQSRQNLKISYHGSITLGLELFSWIVKTSYSGFNILRRVTT